MSHDAKYIFCYKNESDAWSDRDLIQELYYEYEFCTIDFDSNSHDLRYQLTWSKAKHVWHYHDVLKLFKASMIFVKYDDADKFVDLYEEDVFKKLLNAEHPLISYREAILEQSHIEILHGVNYLEDKLRELRAMPAEPFIVDGINYSYENDIKASQIAIIHDIIKQLLARLPLHRRPWEYLNTQERYILRGASNLMGTQNNNNLLKRDNPE
jgi:hypothetical protein